MVDFSFKAPDRSSSIKNCRDCIRRKTGVERVRGGIICEQCEVTCLERMIEPSLIFEISTEAELLFVCFVPNSATAPATSSSVTTLRTLMEVMSE